MEMMADAHPTPELERVVIRVAEHWYQRRYQRDVVGHVVIPVSGILPIPPTAVAVDLIEAGLVPQRMTVAVDSLSGFVHEVSTPVACRRCEVELAGILP